MPLPISHPQDFRKDMATLTLTDQNQTACLTDGWRVGRWEIDGDPDMEGLMAFLFRLYACYINWYARSRGCEAELPEVFGDVAEHAAPLKPRLFLTVPHEFHVAARPIGENPDALGVRSLRVPGTNRTQHFVLFPGARRELCLRKGRPVIAMRWFGRACAFIFEGCAIVRLIVKSIVTGGMNAACVNASIQNFKAESSYIHLIPP